MVLGFSAVIVLLLAAGFIGVKNAQLIQENAGALARNELVTTRLIEELQREQATLNATFYKLSSVPELVDRDRVLAELDEADRAIGRLVEETSGGPQQQLWKGLNSAVLAFSLEARRLLAKRDVPGYSSRDMFRRHEEVTRLAARLIGSGYARAATSQAQIEQRSRRLVNESFFLLGGCLLLALLCAYLTVRVTTELFRKMEWQSGELSRVTWHMLENQETTARRFSHELHDELGQALTAVKANLSALSADPLHDKLRLEDCGQLVDEAIRNVRELSQLLRPTILDDFGLDAGLRWLAERFAQRTGIEVDYHSDFHDRLQDETETHVFRIVQEALTNVARHSGASQVGIDLQKENGRIHLSLRDNGKGFVASDGAMPSGMGLIGMRARARSAGGELKVESQDGAGVAIQLWAPAANGNN
jgi:signal transduction histidine kinase